MRHRRSCRGCCGSAWHRSCRHVRPRATRTRCANTAGRQLRVAQQLQTHPGAHRNRRCRHTMPALDGGWPARCRSRVLGQARSSRLSGQRASGPGYGADTLPGDGAAPGRGMKREVILVVDDEAPMRKYLSANLTARGYEVLTAEDGTEALKLLGEHTFDLLILDIMMPGPDGLAVLEAARRDSSVPVLILSARGREADKVHALDLGADDYLTKPFGVEELLARVRAALRRADAAP